MRSTRFADPLWTPRTFEAAVEQILAGVERSRLRSGARLPNEAELAAQLEISKPTLRQALRVLERAGAITVRAGKGGGIFLASELLPYDAVAGNVALETNAVIDAFAGRRVVERAVAHAAAAVATREDYAELERINRLIAGHGCEPGAVGRADAMLHRAIARATGNRLLEDAMRLVVRRLAPLRDLLTPAVDEIGLIIDIHDRQLRAMRTLESVELDAVLDEHFRVLEERFARSIGQSWSALFDGGARSTPFEPSWRKLASLRGGYRTDAWQGRAQADPGPTVR